MTSERTVNGPTSESHSSPGKNTGLPVHGYQPQSDSNVKLVNGNKEAEELVLRGLDALAQMPGIDKRWLAIGRTHIEQGFMAVNRAVFNPGRVVLASDHPEIGNG